MDKVIVTALLVIAGVTAAGLVMTTLTPIVGDSSRSVVESQKDLSERIETDLEITAAFAESTIAAKAWIKNTGSTNISFLNQSDVFVSSLDRSQFVFLCFQPNDDCTVADNNWNAFERNGTTPKEGYWTENETIQISIGLKDEPLSRLDTSKTYNLEFSTANGIKTIYQFKLGQ